MNNLKLYLVILMSLMSSSFSLSVNAQEETVLERIEKTGLLRVGIREDAVPFGYRNINQELEGLCLDFIAILREKIKQKLTKKVIAVKLYKSTLFNRFELVSDRIVDLECGPNTIREVPDYNIQFSSQLLIKTDNQKRINPNSSLKDIKIGVLKNTSNEQLMIKKYPLANLIQFQGVTGRYRGIQAVQGGKIDAFASDGILLLGEAVVQRLRLGQEYQLIPKNPIDCEKYGLILPDNDPQWLGFIDSVIMSNSEKKIYQEWFGEITPQIDAIQSFCQGNKAVGEKAY